jgi:hypothetical protein
LHSPEKACSAIPFELLLDLTTTLLLLRLAQ